MFKVLKGNKKEKYGDMTTVFILNPTPCVHSVTSLKVSACIQVILTTPMVKQGEINSTVCDTGT